MGLLRRFRERSEQRELRWLSDTDQPVEVHDEYLHDEADDRSRGIATYLAVAGLLAGSLFLVGAFLAWILTSSLWSEAPDGIEVFIVAPVGLVLVAGGLVFAVLLVLLITWLVIAVKN